MTEVKTASARVPEPNATTSPARMSHVVLRSLDIGRMVEWYCNVLGAQPMLISETIGFVTFDDEHHRIAIVRRPDMEEAAPNAVGLDHVAFGYGTLGELVDTYERLRADGRAPYRTVNHGMTTSIYYRDPDGNGVELFVNNFPSVAALNDWFATGAFDRDPYGVLIDADELCRRYHAGEPEAELLRPLA